ncbi:MAG TPA: hypothetical protein VIL12_06020 [Acidimicrobiia bacterium]
MAKHRQDRPQHDHDFEVLPTAGGLSRLVCRRCHYVGVGLTEELVETPTLGRDEARSILEALAGVRPSSPWPEVVAG